MSNTKTKQGSKKIKVSKTVKLTRDERVLLNRFIKDFTTQEQAADALGIKRGAYLRIKELGRGNGSNIQIVRSKIQSAA